jgi:hypothetical protein
MDHILDVSFFDSIADECSLNEHEREWINSLEKLVHSEISLHLSIEDFKHFFKWKQERTSYLHLVITGAITKPCLNAFKEATIRFQILFSQLPI